MQFLKKGTKKYTSNPKNTPNFEDFGTKKVLREEQQIDFGDEKLVKSVQF